MDFAFAVIGGYLLGSIPFGLLLTRLAGLGDIRAVGSGNIGATNVLRTGRKDVALATLFLDGAKAALAMWIARSLYGADAGWIAGAAAMLGHCFPVWLKFKGGKGVATFFGAAFMGIWMLGTLTAAVWLATAYTFRFSSLGALVATAVAPILVAFMGQGPWGIGAVAFMSALVWFRHRDNLARLMKGTEPKIGAKG